MNCQLRDIVTNLENMKNWQTPKIKRKVNSSSIKARKS